MNSIPGKALSAALVCLLFSTGAQAGVIAVAFTFVEGTEGQNIQDTCTSYVTGVDLCAQKTYRIAPSPEIVSIAYEFPGSNPSAVNRLIGLTEPGSSRVSDLISVISDAGSPNILLLDFVSDNELGKFDLTGYGLGIIGPLDCAVGASVPAINRVFSDCIEETGMLQVVFDNSDPGPGGTVSVRSDIPEPGSVALLGLGVAGLGFARRRAIS